VRKLESAISEFIAVHKEQPKPFVWTKSAGAILNSIGRFTPALWLLMAQTILKKSVNQEASFQFRFSVFGVSASAANFSASRN